MHPTVLTDIGHTVRKWRIQFQAPPQAATYAFDLHIMSDSYCGTDVMEHIQLNVQDVTKLEDKVSKAEIAETESEGKSNYGCVDTIEYTEEEEEYSEESDSDESYETDTSTDTDGEEQVKS